MLPQPFLATIQSTFVKTLTRSGNRDMDRGLWSKEKQSTLREVFAEEVTDNVGPTWWTTWWPTWCPTCRWTRWPIWRWTRWLTWRWTRWLTWLPTMVGSHGLIGRRAASEKLGPGGPLDFVYYLYLMSWGGDNGKVLTQIWISKLNKTWYLWRADLLHKTWFLSSLLRRDRRNLWRAKSKPLFFL